MRRPTPRKFAYESLEKRNLLAGVVMVTRDTSGNLLITGDTKANRITVEQVTPSSFKVTGYTHGGSATGVKLLSTGTTTPSKTITQITGNVTIVLGRGADRVDVQGTITKEMYLPGDLSIFGDQRTTSEYNSEVADDYIRVVNVNVNDDLSIYTQSGDDTVIMGNVFCYDIMSINTGWDNDTIRMSAVSCNDDILIDTAVNGESGAADKVRLDDVRAGYASYEYDQGTLRIRTSRAADDVQLRKTRADFFECLLFAGNDYLNLINAAWDNSWNANGGTGSDTLNRYPGPGASFGYDSFAYKTNINKFSA